MLLYHPSGLQSLCRIGPMNIYSWSRKIVLTEGTWFGLIVQLRCLPAALVTVSEYPGRRSPKPAWHHEEMEPGAVTHLTKGQRETSGSHPAHVCSTPSLSQPLSWDSVNYKEQRRWISALTDKGDLLEKQTPWPELRRWLTNLGSYLHSQNKWFRPEYKCSCDLLPWFN